MEWSNAKPPFPDQAALYDHIRKTPVRKARSRQAERQRRGGVQDRRPRDRGRIRVAVPVARRMGPACALVEIKDGKATCWSGAQKSHFVQRGRRRDPRHAADKCTSSGRRAPAPMAATTPTMPRWMRRCWPRRSAGRCGAIHARARHRMGPEGPGLDPPRPRRDRRPGQGHRLRVHQQGLFARRRQPNGSKPFDTLAGQTGAWR